MQHKQSYSQLFQQPHPDGQAASGQVPFAQAEDPLQPRLPFEQQPDVSVVDDVGHQADFERQQLLAGIGQNLAELAARRIVEGPSTPEEHEADANAEGHLPRLLREFIRNYYDFSQPVLLDRKEVGMRIVDPNDTEEETDELYWDTTLQSLEVAGELVMRRYKNDSSSDSPQDLWELLENANPSKIASFGGVVKDTVVRATTRSMGNYSDEAKEELLHAERIVIGVAMMAPVFAAKIAEQKEKSGESDKLVKHGELAYQKLLDRYKDLSGGFVVKASNPAEKLIANRHYAPRRVFQSMAAFMHYHMLRAREEPQYRNEWIKSLVLLAQEAEEEHPEPLQTEWVILPEGGDGAERDKRESVAGEKVEPFVDSERIEKLHELVRVWGSGKVMKGKLEGSGRNHSYYVAVLPQEVDGHVIEHVVADCEEGPENAIFAYRADKPGNVHSWQYVFDGNKTRAKANGAKRILHKQHVDENVMEYLTRPVAQLDDPNYRR